MGMHSAMLSVDAENFVKWLGGFSVRYVYVKGRGTVRATVVELEVA